MAVLEPIMMAMHELSHAMVGWAVGLRVFGIELGTGPIVWRCRVRGFLIRFHLVPVGGLCHAAPKQASGARWRLILFTAAGPLSHAVVLLVLVTCFWSWRVPPAALSRHEGWIASLTLLNLLMFLRNLWPRDVSREGLKIPNDGKLLRSLFRSKNSNFNAWLDSREARELDLCFEKGRLAEARCWLERFRSHNKQSILTSIYELNLLGAQKRWDEVITKTTEWRAVFSGESESSALSAWAAVATVYEGGNLVEAERLCDESMALVPWDPSTQSVHALVLLAQGRTPEAEEFLRKSGTGASWAARAAAAHMWAEIYRRKGNARRQRKWESRASTLDPAGAFRVPAHANSATV